MVDTTQTQQPTREQVDSLKAAWAYDPIWDIENTEGFEAYRDELSAFAQEMYAKWDAQRQQRLVRKAEELGIPGNLKLAQYVIDLEARITALANEIERIERFS